MIGRDDEQQKVLAQSLVLAIARENYVEPSVFPTNNEEAGGLGDGLATFIYHELSDVTEGYDDEAFALDLGIEALEKARHELDSVIAGLQRRKQELADE